MEIKLQTYETYGPGCKYFFDFLGKYGNLEHTGYVINKLGCGNGAIGDDALHQCIKCNWTSEYANAIHTTCVSKTVDCEIGSFADNTTR